MSTQSTPTPFIPATLTDMERRIYDAAWTSAYAAMWVARIAKPATYYGQTAKNVADSCAYNAVMAYREPHLP